MPSTINPRLKSWASDIDGGTITQAEKASRLPIVSGHVALMPDAHVGIGATVGSVIPTEGAIIPSAVGVDIGCGMIAAELDVTASQLPDDLGPLLSRIERAVPAGVGQGHRGVSDPALQFMVDHQPATDLTPKQEQTALEQFGSLGSGNHFVEVCLDERDHVWVVLHSGSRGIGNQLAQQHISRAKHLAKMNRTPLEDPDLAWFTQGTSEFDRYVRDLLWAQDYARANRDRMMSNTLRETFGFLGFGTEVNRVNAHHNFAQLESHGGKRLWITRKGAIQADRGRLGIIPGSMGTRSYIVEGKGNPDSWNSCSHGAGRRYSRTAARKQFTVADLTREMGDRTWLKHRAKSLLDEIPSAYKDIDQVMADQTDLVGVKHTLRQILNYKGV
jgi:tRNA-splicing ligase RtcB